jgi:acyl-CoA thioester hydrolase
VIDDERRMGSCVAEIPVRLKEIACDHVYFATVFTWFEVGRAELCRRAGVPYRMLGERGLGSFVTTATAKYDRPIPATGTVRLESRLVEMGRSRFGFAYSICGQDSDVPMVTGHTTHAMATLAGRLCRLPADFRDAFVVVADEPRTSRPTQKGRSDTESWSTRLRVRYEETDAFGIMYYGNYFAWMEAAWSGRLSGGPWDVAIGLADMAAGGVSARSFPVVHAECRYLSPARYDDEAIISVGASAIGAAKVQLDYRILKADTGDELAVGQTVHVASEGGRVVRVPDDLAESLALARAEVP